MNMTSSRRSAGGLDAWFAELYDQHYWDIYAFVYRRTAAAASAEDVTAEVFATVWAKRNSAPHDAIVPWMYGVAHNKLRAEQRSYTRRERLSAKVAQTRHDGPVDPGESVPDDLSHRESAQALLDSLDDRDREVLCLWAWEELGPHDIARVLGISQVAARSRLSRAKKRAAKAAAATNSNVITLFSA